MLQKMYLATDIKNGLLKYQTKSDIIVKYLEMIHLMNPLQKSSVQLHCQASKILISQLILACLLLALIIQLIQRNYNKP